MLATEVPEMIEKLGIGACAVGRAARPKVGARLAAATPAGARLTRRATLHYDIRGRSFPLPLVTGKISGHPVLMLVDTGANSHVVAGWFARKVGLSMRKLGDVGTDHVGKSIATYRIDKINLTLNK